jgi:hypothetical protein
MRRTRAQDERQAIKRNPRQSSSVLEVRRASYYSTVVSQTPLKAPQSLPAHLVLHIPPYTAPMSSSRLLSVAIPFACQGKQRCFSACARIMAGGDTGSGYSRPLGERQACVLGQCIYQKGTLQLTCHCAAGMLLLDAKRLARTCTSCDTSKRSECLTNLT